MSFIKFLEEANLPIYETLPGKLGDFLVDVKLNSKPIKELSFKAGPKDKVMVFYHVTYSFEKAATSRSKKSFKISFDTIASMSYIISLSEDKWVQTYVPNIIHGKSTCSGTIDGVKLSKGECVRLEKILGGHVSDDPKQVYSKALEKEFSKISTPSIEDMRKKYK